MKHFIRKYFKKIGIQYLDKRQRFALQTVILTVGILLAQFVLTEMNLLMVIILSVSSYILTFWSLREDIKGVEWILLFILPVFFTSSLSLFYLLLPQRMIVRLVITVIFAIGTYAILLVENIYNVAVERSIQLLRAAQSVGLLISLAIVFLTAMIIYSLRLQYWQSMTVISLISFILAMQSFWSVKLETSITLSLLIPALVVALGMGQVSLALSFWPIENASYSLFLTGCYYSMVGIFQYSLMDRLFSNYIREYILVFLFTLFLALLTTRWG